MIHVVSVKYLVAQNKANTPKFLDSTLINSGVTYDLSMSLYKRLFMFTLW